jgi:addiction module HigA family antidote
LSARASSDFLLFNLAENFFDANRIFNEIVLSKRGISADTALRLARYFNMPAQFWLGLQMDDDLDVAEDRSAKRLDREVRVYATAA